jgi:hypothetical protein
MRPLARIRQSHSPYSAFPWCWIVERDSQRQRSLPDQRCHGNGRRPQGVALGGEEQSADAARGARRRRINWTSLGVNISSLAPISDIAESPNRKYLKLWEERAALAEGQAYLLQHHASKAMPRLERARQLEEEMYNAPSAELIPARTALALAYFQMGNRTESAKLLALAESIRKSHPHLAERFEAPLRELRSQMRSKPG